MVLMSDQTVAVRDDMMDFTTERKLIQFRLDDDVFTGTPEVGIEVAFEFSAKAERLSDESLPLEERKEIIKDMMRALLIPESADHFITRLSDTRNPIGIAKFTTILHWLFEQYGLRPTQPELDSSPGSGSPESGTSLTASISDAV